MKNAAKLKITETPEFLDWMELNKDADLTQAEMTYARQRRIEKDRDYFLTAAFLTLIALIVAIVLSVLPISSIG